MPYPHVMIGHDTFVFSSSRRHTRWNCDWSSDVCSSDLVRVADEEIAALLGDDGVAGEREGFAVDAHEAIALADDGIAAALDVRRDLLGARARLVFHGFVARDAVSRTFERRRGGRRVVLAARNAVARTFRERSAGTGTDGLRRFAGLVRGGQ